MHCARCYRFAVFVCAKFHNVELERMRFAVFAILGFGNHPFPAVTIPAHFDMFAGNGVSPKLFTDYMRVKYPHLKTVVCRYGQRVIVKRR